MISKDDVKYIASLSRIHLRDEEVEHLTKDLSGILDYITKLESLDTSNTEPTSHVLPLKNVYREDKVKPSLTQEQSTSFAVQKHEGFFKVPKVIE